MAIKSKLRYILEICWLKRISNIELWRKKGQEDINEQVKKRKFKWLGKRKHADLQSPNMKS